MTYPPRPNVILYFLTFSVIGLSLYSTFAYWSAYRRQEMMYNRLASGFATKSVLKYGTVEEVHDGALTVSLAPTGLNQPQRVVVRVPEGTFVARQELQGQNGVFDRLSPTVPASLGDMRVGDRVALMFDVREGNLSAVFVLFGYPL